MIKPNRTIQVYGTVDGWYTALTGDAGRPRPTGRPVLYYRCSNPTSRHMLTENANLLNKRGAVL